MRKNALGPHQQYRKSIEEKETTHRILKESGACLQLLGEGVSWISFAWRDWLMTLTFMSESVLWLALC